MKNHSSVEEPKLLHDFDDAYIYFRQDKEMIKVFLKDIQYIESLRDYVRIVTVTQQIVTYNKISYLEKKLPENNSSYSQILYRSA
jgi:DNA-binding LytR/AlgR family response regulator